MRWAGDRVFVAVRVRDRTPGAAPRTKIGDGDHVQLIVLADSGGVHRGLSPKDLVILVGAPARRDASEAFVGSLGFTGFVSKWRRDDRDMAFSEFFLTSFAGSHADSAQVQWAGGRLPGGGGYAVEIALPRNGRDTLRVSLSVRDTGRHGGIWALALRNYPGNPATFANVALH